MHEVPKIGCADLIPNPLRGFLFVGGQGHEAAIAPRLAFGVVRHRQGLAAVGGGLALGPYAGKCPGVGAGYWVTCDWVLPHTS